MTAPNKTPRGRKVAPRPEPFFAELDLSGWFNPLIWLIAFGIVALSLAPVGVIYALRPGSAASSWLLATAIYIPCLIFAAMTLHFGRATPLKARLVAAGLALGGLGFAVWGGLADYGQRAVTLFETEVEMGGATAAQDLAFAVEHPGVEHTLSVWPTGAGPLGATRSVGLRVELFDGEGGEILVREATLEPRSADSSTDWDVLTLTFTPGGGGDHILRITALTPGVPRVHVRVVDPLKTDGQRMPGY